MLLVVIIYSSGGGVWGGGKGKGTNLDGLKYHGT